MITTKEELKEVLAYEKNIHGIKHHLIAVNQNDILHRHLLLLRKAEYFTNTGKKYRSAVYKFRLHVLQNRYCLHVPLNTCEKGLSIAHLGPVVINGNAHLGRNARIHVGVNIGANGTDKAPQIGNDVYIGPGAKIFGEIIIADGCRIGANAVVNRSCQEEGALLVGVPARIKKQQNGEC